MTGPEHYREADRLLTEAADADPTAEHGDVAMVLQFAQVHATLALAAATAYPAVKDYIGDEATDPRNWTGATS